MRDRIGVSALNHFILSPSRVCARRLRPVVFAACSLVATVAALAQDPAPPQPLSDVPVQSPAPLPTEAQLPTQAQLPTLEWPAGVAVPEQPPAGGNTTIVPRSGEASDQPAGEAPTAQVRLIALLTADGQKIDRDIVWRIFTETGGETGKSTLVNTMRTPSPMLRVPAGNYVVNAAFGRANVTRKISVKPGETTPPPTERFVLNAGGMRVNARVPQTAASATAVSFSIFSDRDQSGDRRLIITGVKPGLIIRLNAGIYHIVSTVGDANAVVESDVTVEAGKLSEATVTHAAAKATFKLVSRPGGEALAGTQWTIRTQQGQTVKESTGALPTHVLAPGTYSAVARLQGKTLERAFTLVDGQATQVEVIVQ